MLSFDGILKKVRAVPEFIRQLIATAPLQARCFLIISLCFGSLFCVINPPMQAPDEPQHYLRAYSLSQGDLLNRATNGGATLPASVVAMSQELVVANHPVARANIHLIKHYFRTEPTRQKSFVYFKNTAVYPGTAYLPQTLGILIGRFLHLPLLFGFYLARFLNLTEWIVLVFLAIRITPFGRWFFAAVAVLPMLLYQASSLSADATLNGLLFLIIAILFAYIRNQRLSRVAAISAGIYLTVATSIKPFYALLALTFLHLLWQSGESTKRKLKLEVALIGAILLFGIGWQLLTSPIASHIHEVILPGEHISISEQAHFVLLNPLAYVWTVIQTLFIKNFSFLLNSALGIFGWLDIPLPPFSYYLLLGFLGLAFIKDTSEQTVVVSKRVRYLLIAVVTAILLAIITLFYLGYSIVRSTVVDGLQGRYFTPLLLLLVPLIQLRFLKLDLSTNTFRRFYLIGSASLLVLSLFVILDANYFRVLSASY